MFLDLRLTRACGLTRRSEGEGALGGRKRTPTVFGHLSGTYWLAYSVHHLGGGFNLLLSSQRWGWLSSHEGEGCCGSGTLREEERMDWISRRISALCSSRLAWNMTRIGDCAFA